jgi:F-type H+-transporting ATPase subunit a
MRISPDQLVFFQYGYFKLNLTIAATWGIMILLVAISRMVTKKIKYGVEISNFQCALEIIVMSIRSQIQELGLKNADTFMPFIGALFLFISAACVLTVLPFYESPTSSLSTTTSLAICVFIAVPFYGIKELGIAGYLKTYLEPSVIMLPFNIISELSRTIALAIRLFGNMMSGTLIIAILLTVTPLFFPIVMSALGLLTGLVQAYIFATLATVFIAGATISHE